MNLTENLKLKKPGQNDLVNIDDLNSNSEVLDEEIGFINAKLEKQYHLLNEFEQDNKNMMGSKGSANELLPLDEDWRHEQDKNVHFSKPERYDIRIIADKTALVKFKLHEPHDNNFPLYAHFPIKYIGSGVGGVFFNLYDEDLKLGCYTTPYSKEGNYEFKKHSSWSGKPLVYLGMEIQIPDESSGDRFIEFDRSVGVSKEGYDILPPSYFYNFQKNIAELRRNINTIGKNQMILTTTCEVVLSEKIAEGSGENIDFYKSQLEKLKLTQEVDLNLLLTL